MSSGFWKPASTTSPRKSVWLPRSTELCTRQSTHATAWSRMGAPVGPSWKGKPLSACPSTSTGLVNLRTMARSSRSRTFTLNTRPSPMSSWVSAGFSTDTASSLGSELTWAAQLAVMALRRSPARLPMT